VLGNGADQLFQAIDFFLAGGSLLIPLFGTKIFWWQIGWHGFLFDF
jgi:hypothetical protein